MTDATIVGSAAFELRATRDKIPADLEAARKEIEDSAKKTEVALGDIVGSGTEKGAKKAAAALQEPKAAGEEAGKAIRDSMAKAGEEVGSAIAKGAAKAKNELEQLAQKAREVQQIKLPTPTIPTEATHTLTTNPINGVQSWAPNDLAGPRSVRNPMSSGVSAPALKQTTEAAKETAEAVADIAPAADSGAAGLGRLAGGAAVAGVAAGALIGGAILVTKTLWEMGRAAMQSAGEIDDAAKKIGVSTDTLQEFRYIATKIGADAGAADTALASFADKLASAASRLSKEDVKSFGALLLNPDDLKKFKSTEEALDEVIDRIGNLKSETDRAAIADKLGLGPLVVALRGGSEEIARLRDEAQTLGVVMDAELVRRGADAQSQFETLSRVIDIQLKSAFIDLAPAIVTVIGLVAQLGRVLNEYLDLWRDYDSKTTRGLQQEAQRLSRENSGLMQRYGSLDQMNGRDADRATVVGSSGGAAGPGGAIMATSMGPGARETFDNNQRRLSQIFDEIKQRDADRAPAPRQDSGTGTSLALPPARERVDRSAEREARRAERVEQEIFRARQRLLQAAEGDVLTAQERYDLARAQLRMDREARDAEVQSKTDRGEIKEAERRQLDAANASADAMEDRVMTDNAFREIQDERLATEKLLSGLTADLLSLQSGAARTAKERQRVELDLLEITQRQRREALRLELDRNPSLTQAQRDGAMATNGRIERGERDAVIRNNLSPLQAWRDESLKTADEIREAYENVGARGLDALNSGIVDAIMNTKSLGETFSSVAKQILADLLSISVRRGITEPLADMLFGGSGSGSGSGGIGASIFSAIKSTLRIPGFSSGVSNFGGGLAYVHAGEILANLPQGTDVIPAHAVQAMGSKGSVSRVVVTTNDDRFNAYVDDRVAPQSAAVFSTARKTVPSDMARTDRYTLGRRR